MYYTINLAWVVPKPDNTIHWINHHPEDGVACFLGMYPLDNDLSSGQH